MRIPPLQVSEIFFSLQGEASRMGIPTAFIRLTGCPLRCRWCDSEYAFTGGVSMTIAETLAAIRPYPTRRVCLTGGEPLAQKSAFPLMTALADAGYDVALETSGALPIAAVDPRVSRIVDIKTPSSGEEGKNLKENLDFLNSRDEIKIVIADRADYEWARDFISRHAELSERCPLWLSPAEPAQSARLLAEWLLADGLPARLQIQLHKALWGNMRGK